MEVDRAGARWAIRVHGDDGPGNATGRAICVDVRPRYVEKTGDVPGMGSTLPFVDCPDERHVVGIGGRAALPPTSGGVTKAAPADSTFGDNNDANSFPDDRAALTFTNNSSAEESWRAFAVCLR